MIKNCILKNSIVIFAALIVLISAVTCFSVNVCADAFDSSTVKVGLNYTASSSKEISVSVSEGGFTLMSGAEKDNSVTIDVNILIFTSNDESLIVKTVFDSEIMRVGINETISVCPSDADCYLSYGEYEYYGYFELYASGDGRITIINVTDLESYLKGVLPSEVYPSWNLEALKAAAVVSRTYALKNILSSSHASAKFDICATTHCQMYSGKNKENERTNQAISDTSSLILMYEGSIATTPYHSSTGGYTESAADAWGGNADKFPYLTNVLNPYEDYRSIPNGKWVSVVTADELYNSIPVTYRSKLQNSNLIFNLIRNRSGFIGNMTVNDSYGNTLTLKNSGNVRAFFGNLVKSANFGITKTFIAADAPSSNVSVLTANGAYDETGIGGINYITSDGIKTAYGFEEVYVIDGKGYGHGVGMSQFGAKFMADAGFNFDTILSTYYPGTDLVTTDILTEGQG